MSVSFSSVRFNHKVSAVFFAMRFGEILAKENRKNAKYGIWRFLAFKCRSADCEKSFGISPMGDKFAVWFHDKFDRFNTVDTANRFDLWYAETRKSITKNQIAEIIGGSKSGTVESRIANRTAEIASSVETEIDCPIENLMRLAKDIGMTP